MSQEEADSFLQEALCDEASFAADQLPKSGHSQKRTFELLLRLCDLAQYFDSLDANVPTRVFSRVCKFMAVQESASLPISTKILAFRALRVYGGLMFVKNRSEGEPFDTGVVKKLMNDISKSSVAFEKKKSFCDGVSLYEAWFEKDSCAALITNLVVVSSQKRDELIRFLGSGFSAVGALCRGKPDLRKLSQFGKDLFIIWEKRGQLKWYTRALSIEYAGYAAARVPHEISELGFVQESKAAANKGHGTVSNAPAKISLDVSTPGLTGSAREESAMAASDRSAYDWTYLSALLHLSDPLTIDDWHEGCAASLAHEWVIRQSVDPEARWTCTLALIALLSFEGCSGSEKVRVMACVCAVRCAYELATCGETKIITDTLRTALDACEKAELGAEVKIVLSREGRVAIEKAEKSRLERSESSKAKSADKCPYSDERLRVRTRKVGQIKAMITGSARLLGIIGEGGSGKTFLATQVSSEMDKFSGGKFFFKAKYDGNIDERASRIKELQAKVFGALTGRTIPSANSVRLGRKILCEACGDKRPRLIVVDDVWSADVLEALIPDPWPYGDGLRMIVTSRSERCISSQVVESVGGIELCQTAFPEVCLDEALDLLRREMRVGEGELPALGKKLVQSVGCFPIAVSALGKRIWEDSAGSDFEIALEQTYGRLSGILRNHYLSALGDPGYACTNNDWAFGAFETSFQALSDRWQHLALYIACFPHGNVAIPARLLAAGMAVLSPKSCVQALSHFLHAKAGIGGRAESSEVFVHDLVIDFFRYKVEQKEGAAGLTKMHRKLVEHWQTDSAEDVFLTLSELCLSSRYLKEHGYRHAYLAEREDELLESLEWVYAVTSLGSSNVLRLRSPRTDLGKLRLQEMRISIFRVFFYACICKTEICDSREVGTEHSEDTNAKAKERLRACFLASDSATTAEWREAVRMLSVAAGEGHPCARYRLALCYSYGIGVEADLWKSDQLLKRVAREGDKTPGGKQLRGAAYYLRGCIQLVLLNIYRDSVSVKGKLVKRLELARRLGDVDASALLALCYAHGFGTEQNIDEGLNCVEEYLREDEGRVRFEYGDYMYSLRVQRGVTFLLRLREEGTDCQKERVEKLLLHPLVRGYATGTCWRFLLAQQCERGLSAELADKDTEQAMRLYRAEATKTGPIAIESQRRLGMLYMSGRDGNQDLKEAMRFLEMASGNKDHLASFYLAICLLHRLKRGSGSDNDRLEAVRLLEISAARGFVDAMRVLQHLEFT